MKPADHKRSGLQKVLDAPVNLAEMAANAETKQVNVSSIWVTARDDNLVKSSNIFSPLIKIISSHLFRFSESGFEKTRKSPTKIA